MNSEITLDAIRAVTPVILLFGMAMVILVADLFRGKSAAGSAPAMSPVLHLLAVSGCVLAGVGVLAGWDAPAGVFFSGAIRVERFARAFSSFIVLGAFLTTLAAPGYLRRKRIEDGEFHALVLLAAGAMVLLAQSNNLIMIFLSLETFSMAVYALAGLTRDEKRSVEGALKYLILGGLSGGFLLLGLAFIFGATGEIRLDLMAGRSFDPPLFLAGSVLVLVGFGFKLGAFPFQSWIPDVYEGAPTLVTGFMAVAVKASGFAALIRIALVMVDAAPPEAKTTLISVLSWLAALTCIFGNFVAIAQSSAKRMLAYSGIAHTGYLLIGLVAALSMKEPKYLDGRGAALVFYFLPYTLMTCGAFAVIAHIGHGAQDGETFEAFRGLSKRRPLAALCMLIFMVSLAGIPPTAGFWAKLYLFGEAVAAERWDLALVGIATSIVAAYYYLRVVVMMYMAPDRAPIGLPASAGPLPLPETRGAWAIPAVFGLSAVGIAVIGFFPSGLLSGSVRSIETLLRR